jgi:HNH endonuclease
MITYQELIENFYYDKSGFLIRKTKKSSNGSKDYYGYTIIKFKGRQYKAHRLIWMYHYGTFPQNVIDHKNGNKSDNRIENLRDVKQAENVRATNRKPNYETGVIGVCIDKATKSLKKMFVTTLNKKVHRFYTIEDAVLFRRLNNLPI